VSLTITEANPSTRGRSGTGEKAAKIGGGAVVGGILGVLIGGNATGAIIGGVAGAAAGTAIALGTEDVDAVLEEGSEMTLRIDEPLTVRRDR
jgi:outer membrane lipoprotein SlyB